MLVLSIWLIGLHSGCFVSCAVVWCLPGCGCGYGLSHGLYKDRVA